MSINRKKNRLRRAKKIRSTIYLSGKPRLSVHKTPKHIYAQVFDCGGSKVYAQSSTLEASVKSEVVNTGNATAAVEVGRLIARRCLDLGIKSVAFDRSGFSYHGRIASLADAAREEGLHF